MFRDQNFVNGHSWHESSGEESDDGGSPKIDRRLKRKRDSAGRYIKKEDTDWTDEADSAIIVVPAKRQKLDSFNWQRETRKSIVKGPKGSPGESGERVKGFDMDSHPMTLKLRKREIRIDSSSVEAEDAASVQALPAAAVMHQPTANISREEPTDTTTPSGDFSEYGRFKKVLQSHLETVYAEHRSLVESLLANARCSGKASSKKASATESLRPSRAQKTNPPSLNQNWFTNVPSIQEPVRATASKEADPTNSYGTISQVTFSKSGAKGSQVYVTAPLTHVSTKSIDVPKYAVAAAVKRSVIAEDEDRLLYWPYDPDDIPEEDELEIQVELQDKFFNLIEERSSKLLQSAKAEKFARCAIEYLRGLDLLCPNIRELLANRRSKDDAKWRSRAWVEQQYVTESDNADDAKLVLAAMAWKQVCGFNLLLAVRAFQAKFGNDFNATKPGVGTTKQTRLGFSNSDRRLPYDDIACRVCHLHKCPFHRPPTTDFTVSTFEDEIFDSEPNEGSEFDKKVRGKSKRSLDYWLTHSRTHLLNEREPFVPCHHDGTCEDAQCTCFQQKISCEKTCACNEECSRRYRGCSCDSKDGGCWTIENCECFRLNRECDPDLCGGCGVREVLNPKNREVYNAKRRQRLNYNEVNDEVVVESAPGSCLNCMIQLGISRRTILGQSEVQGFGLFAGQDIRENEYLGEYTGELITKEEADRRGTIYYRQGALYLFGLNKGHELDPARAGNKFRFINNSNLEENINCYAQPMLCNTVTRIGFFAKKDVKAGEEFFWHYGYSEELTKYFWERGEHPTSVEAANPLESHPSGNAILSQAKKSSKPALSGNSSMRGRRTTFGTASDNTGVTKRTKASAIGHLREDSRTGISEDFHSMSPDLETSSSRVVPSSERLVGSRSRAPRPASSHSEKAARTMAITPPDDDDSPRLTLVKKLAMNNARTAGSRQASATRLGSGIEDLDRPLEIPDDSDDTDFKYTGPRISTNALPKRISPRKSRTSLGANLDADTTPSNVMDVDDPKLAPNANIEDGHAPSALDNANGTNGLGDGTATTDDSFAAASTGKSPFQMTLRAVKPSPRRHGPYNDKDDLR